MKLLTKVLANVSFPLTVAIGLAVAPLAVSQEACNPQTLAQVQTAAGPVAEAALDGITCVTSVASTFFGPVSLAGVVAACAQFAVSADLAYSVISHMLSTQLALGASDAGVLKVGVTDPALVRHLAALLATR